MKIRYMVTFAAMAVAISALLAFDAPPPLRAQNTDADLEQFRSDLTDYFAELQELAPYLGDDGPDVSVTLGEVEEAIPELTPEELGVLHDAISQNPAWWDLPSIIRSSIGPEAQARQATAEAAQGNSVSLLSHTCPAPAGGGLIFTGPQKHIQTEFLLKKLALSMKGKALLLEAATQGIPEPLNIPLVAAWVVGEELVLAGELVVLGTEEKNAINDECEEDNHRAVVHDVVAPRIDTTVSSRASQSSLDAHDANLTTRADAIDAKLVVIDGKLDVIGANIDEILAREIEERLAASSCLHIVSLYLPAANGGRLETVRDIVGGLITDQTNAGLGVGSAQVRFDKGIDLLGDDSFKEAYKEFCSAYRQLLSAR